MDSVADNKTVDTQDRAALAIADSSCLLTNCWLMRSNSGGTPNSDLYSQLWNCACCTGRGDARVWGLHDSWLVGMNVVMNVGMNNDQVPSV